MTAVFLLVELPSCLQLTLSWGASTLWTKQVELPCDLAIGEIGARLQGDRRGCELRTATRVQPIRSEQRVSLESDGFILSIDAVTDDIAPALPSHVDPRAAAFDLGSLLLHGALAVMLFLLADPLADQKLEPLEELIIPHAGKVMDLGVVLPTDQPVDKVPGGHRAVDDKPDGAAGPGASTRAAHGAARQPSAGGNYTARPEASAHDGLSDVETWSMITLLGRAAAGSKDPSSGKDPWSGAGLDSGPSWGDPGGIGDDGGIGALSLSGIGEGGGSHSEGIGLGPGGVGTCGANCSGAPGGELKGRPTAKPPTIRLCGRLRKDGSIQPTCMNSSGRLPPETVQRVVQQNFGRFRLCYENDLRAQPSLNGRVTLRFVIGRDGSVGSVAASPEAGVPNTTAACMAKAAYGLSFPAPEGGVVNVVYPIMLQPG